MKARSHPSPGGSTPSASIRLAAPRYRAGPSHRAVLPGFSVMLCVAAPLCIAVLLGSAAPSGRAFYVAAAAPGAPSKAPAGSAPDNPLVGLAALERALAAAQPGDRFLLKRGDVFRGSFACAAKGEVAAPITIGAYGAGPMPLVTDLEPLGPWKKDGPSLWRARAPGGPGTRPAMLLRDGKPLALGRYPAADAPWGGYLRVEGHAGKSAISSAALPAGVNWAGAEAVVRTRRWVLDQVPVLGRDGATLRLGEGLSYEPYDGFGFFLQDHPACLAREGDWRYDAATGDVVLFSAADPGKRRYEAPTRATVADFAGCARVRVEGVEFRGGRTRTVRVEQSLGLALEGCAVTLAGARAVGGWGARDLRIAGCRVAGAQGLAIDLGGAAGLAIAGNRVEDTGRVAGMGGGGDGTYTALVLDGEDILVERNAILRSGYDGISFNGDRVTVRENLVDGFALVKDDAGGVYTWTDGKTERVARRVERNVVRNGVGAEAGSGWAGGAVNGVYLDDRTGDVLVEGNVVSACAGAGLFVHNAHGVVARGNLLFGNEVQLGAHRDGIAPDFPVRDCRAEGNVLLCDAPGQLLVSLANSLGADPPGIAFAGNAYHRPFERDGGVEIRVGGRYRSIGAGAWASEGDPGATVGRLAIEPYAVREVAAAPLASSGAAFPGWGSWASEGKGEVPVADGAARLLFTAASGATDSRILFYSPGFPVAAGRTYRLSFTARASGPGLSLGFLLRKGAEPWTEVTERRGFEPGTAAEARSIILVPSLDLPDCRAEFSVTEEDYARGGAATDAWVELSGIELREVTATRVDPAAFCRLLANPTEGKTTVAIGAGWTDAWLAPQPAALTLAPWSATVVVRKAAD